MIKLYWVTLLNFKGDYLEIDTVPGAVLLPITFINITIIMSMLKIHRYFKSLVMPSSRYPDHLRKIQRTSHKALTKYRGLLVS